jgi:hypothetical protein
MSMHMQRMMTETKRKNHNPTTQREKAIKQQIEQMRPEKEKSDDSAYFIALNATRTAKCFTVHLQEPTSQSNAKSPQQRTRYGVVPGKKSIDCSTACLFQIIVAGIHNLRISSKVNTS